MSAVVLGLAEIVLWTHDMEASLKFYRDLFGLQMISPPDFAARFLSSGEGRAGIPEMIVLMPHPDSKHAFPGQKQDRVLHHLAFAVDAARYEELQERCREAGLNVRGGIHPVLQGVRTFYVDDPEGNEVEVIAKES